MDEEYIDEEQMEAIQQQTEFSQQTGYPLPPTKESVYKFFREILDRPDSSKFGNVNRQELGLPEITVRGYQSLALDMKKGWNMDKVSDFLMANGEQTLATSLSLKGFLAELFVTQIKKERKSKPIDTKPKGLFSFGKKQPGELQ